MSSIKHPVIISYEGEAERVRGGFEVDVDLRADFDVIEDEFGRNCLPTNYMGLGLVTFRFLVADATWTPPGGRFDFEVLSQPGAFSNVDNGFGFYGAGYTASVRWFPSPEVRQELGFILAAPCGFMPAPSCINPPEPCFQDE